MPPKKSDQPDRREVKEAKPTSTCSIDDFLGEIEKAEDERLGQRLPQERLKNKRQLDNAARRAAEALVITTGHFTADARREATRDGAPAIDLIDGEALCDLLKQTRIGVAITLVEHVSVDEAAFRTL